MNRTRSATRAVESSRSPEASDLWNRLRTCAAQSVEATAGGATPRDDREGEILRARAKALAARPDEAPDPSMYLDVVEFGLASERYAIESVYVREVYPLKDVTPLPGLPPSVLGVMNVRGHILPVVDLKRLFDLPDEERQPSSRVLVLGEGESGIGLYADRVVGAHLVRRAAMQVSLPTLTGIRADWLKAITDDRLVILDGAKVLSDQRLGGQDEA